MEGSSVIRCRQAFAKVIALDLLIIASKPFPINFVQVVGLHHGTADDAPPRRRLEHELDMAEHNVPFRCQLW